MHDIDLVPVSFGLLTENDFLFSVMHPITATSSGELRVANLGLGVEAFVRKRGNC